MATIRAASARAAVQHAATSSATCLVSPALRPAALRALSSVAMPTFESYTGGDSKPFPSLTVKGTKPLEANGVFAESQVRAGGRQGMGREVGTSVTPRLFSTTITPRHTCLRSPT